MSFQTNPFTQYWQRQVLNQLTRDELYLLLACIHHLCRDVDDVDTFDAWFDAAALSKDQLVGVALCYPQFV